MRINFEAVFNKGSGYGNVSVKTCKYLDILGHDVACEQLFGVDKNAEEISHLLKKDKHDDAVTVSHVVPWEKKFDVLWTIAEFSPISYKWKYALDNANKVVTMTEFSKQCLQSITDRDIYIVPNGIEPTYGLANPAMYLPNPDLEKPFRFFSMFEWVPRKQGELLIRSFCEEFNSEDKVELWIKSSQAWQNPLKEVPRILKDYPEMKDKVFYIKKYIDDTSLLYKLFDSYVLPCAGEGFGLTFLEAMCCGLKPIGPRWGGSLSFMNDENSYLVDVGEDEPLIPFSEGLFPPDAMWRVPIMGQLKKTMRKAFEEKAVQPKFWSDRLRSEYSWENTAKKLVKVLES